MSLYSINAKMQWYLDHMYETDEESGELLHPEMLNEFEEVFAEREVKIENTLLYIKNLAAEANAIGQELKTLADRKKALESKAERLKQYVADSLGGEKFETAKVAVSYRRSQGVEIDPQFIEWAMGNGRDDLLRFNEPEADKMSIRNWLKNGGESSYARIVDNTTMTIK